MHMMSDFKYFLSQSSHVIGKLTGVEWVDKLEHMGEVAASL